MEPVIAEKVAIFFSQFPKRHYKKNEIVLRADDQPSGVFYVKEGLVREYTISPKGQETVLLLFNSPAIFPLSWIINHTPNQHFFDTPLPTILYKAPKEAVASFIQENPDVLLELLKRADKRIQRLTTRMVPHMVGNAYTRLITEIIVYTRLFGKTNPQGLSSSNITITELATHAGMSRETVSREMKHLKEKGLITVSQNKLTIPDMQKLEEELVEDC